MNNFVVIFLAVLSCLEFSRTARINYQFHQDDKPTIDFSEYDCKPEDTLVMAHINITLNSTFLIGRNIHKHNCVIFSESIIPEIPSIMFLGGNSNMTTLYANEIQVKELKKENFRNAPYLQRLFLSRNQISALKEDVFSGARNLLHIDLSKNQISEFSPDAFDGLRNLEILDLSRNLITHVPFQLFQDLTNIVFLNLRFNKINVKYGIFPQFVKTLDLSYNSIDIHHKFKIFALLNNLETLLLHGNRIENFDPVIFESKIKFIGLSDNSFSCSLLADIMLLMHSKNIIHVYENKVKNTSNIQGIKCIE